MGISDQTKLHSYNLSSSNSKVPELKCELSIYHENIEGRRLTGEATRKIQDNSLFFRTYYKTNGAVMSTICADTVEILHSTTDSNLKYSIEQTNSDQTVIEIDEDDIHENIHKSLQLGNQNVRKGRTTLNKSDHCSVCGGHDPNLNLFVHNNHFPTHKVCIQVMSLIYILSIQNYKTEFVTHQI